MKKIIKDIFFKIIDKIKDWYDLLVLAFTNWDSEVYVLKDELIHIIYQSGNMIRKGLSVLSNIVSEIGIMVHEMVGALGKSWK